MERLWKVFFIASRALGYTGAYYNGVTGIFTQSKAPRWQALLLFLMRVFLFLCPILYIVAQNIYCQFLNTMKLAIHATELPGCDQKQVYRSSASVFVFWIICVKLQVNDKRIPDYLNDVVKVIKFIEQSSVGALKCPRSTYVVTGVVLLKLLSHTPIQILSEKNLLEGKECGLRTPLCYLYLSSVLMDSCNLFLDFKLTSCYLHYLMHAMIYKCFNNFLNREVALKDRKRIKQLLSMQPVLQRTQLTANKHLSLLLLYTHFKAAVKVYDFMKAFEFDERSLLSRDMPLGYRELDDMDEGLDDSDYYVPVYTRTTKILIEGVFLTFFLIDLLSINLGARLLHHQKRCFKSSSFKLHNNPEAWSKKLTVFKQTSDGIENEIQLSYPKRTFWDTILANRFETLLDDKICVFHIFSYEIYYRNYNAALTVLTSLPLLAVTCDAVQLSLIEKLEAYLKSHGREVAYEF